MSELSFEEDLKIRKFIREPHLSYIDSTIGNRKNVAYLVLQKKEDEILLIDKSGFIIDSVFAGLTEKHIEYIAKNAPRDYKKNILSALADKKMMDGVLEIVRSMDDDVQGMTKNQERINNVIRYIKDNIIAFQF